MLWRAWVWRILLSVYLPFWTFSAFVFDKVDALGYHMLMNYLETGIEDELQEGEV